MQRLINKGITQTLDMKALRMVVPRNVGVVRYDTLSGMKSLKQVMNKRAALIILFNIHTKERRLLNTPGHFFVLAMIKGRPYVFSSTGFTPRKELFLSHSDPTLFERVLPKNVAFNSVRLQQNGDANSCWRYCILFVQLVVRGGMDPRTFINMFSHPMHLHTPDEIVTALTFGGLFSAR